MVSIAYDSRRLPIYPHYSEHPQPVDVSVRVGRKTCTKNRIRLQSTTQKAIGRGGGSILWGECVRHPLIKRASCPVFICTPAAISYINLIYIPPSLSRIPPAHISLSRTPARRASEKPCTAITHNFLATFTHRGAINLSNYVIIFLYCLVSVVFPGRSLTKTRTYRRATVSLVANKNSI